MTRPRGRGISHTGPGRPAQVPVRLTRPHRGGAGEGLGTVDIKKVLLYIAVVFVLYTIITSPVQAAGMVQTGFEGISSAAKGVGAFMTNLVR